MDKRIYLLTAITFIAGLVELIIGGILPLIADDFEVSLGHVGLLISVFSLSYAIAGPILLSLTSKLERKKLIIIVLLVFSLSNILAILGTGFVVLVIARVLSAMCAALLVSLCLTIAAQISSELNRSRAIGIVLIGVSSSLVLGVPLGLVLGNEWGWRAPFILIILLTKCLIILICFSLNKIEAEKVLPLKLQLKTIRAPRIILIHIVSILFFTGHLTLYAFLTPFLQSTLNLTGNSLSIMYFVLGLSAIGGSWSGGYAADRYGVNKTIILAIASYAIVLLSIAFISNPLILVGVLMIWSFLSWSLTPAVQSYLVSVAHQTSGIQQSLNSSNTHIGMAIGSFFGGIIIDLFRVGLN